VIGIGRIADMAGIAAVRPQQVDLLRACLMALKQGRSCRIDASICSSQPND